MTKLFVNEILVSGSVIVLVDHFPTKSSFEVIESHCLVIVPVNGIELILKVPE